jgi:hypothetical protein
VINASIGSDLGLPDTAIGNVLSRIFRLRGHSRSLQGAMWADWVS